MEITTNEERYCLISENLSFDEVLEKIADALQVAPPKFYANHSISAIAWRIDWIISFLFAKKRNLSKLMVASIHRKDYYANDKIKSIYPFPFQSIDDCIATTAKMYLEK